MIQTAPTRSDLFLRFTRRSMVIVLAFIVLLGAGSVAMALWPDGAVSQALARAPWALPIGIIIVAAGVQTSQRRNRFTPDSPEFKAVMNDELRRDSMARARFVALAVVLGVQVPAALLLSLVNGLPVLRALMAMAVLTITIGMTALIVAFLTFDRD